MYESSQDLAYPDLDDFEESEHDGRIAAIVEVDKKKADYSQASVFLTGLGLDASFVRDLRLFNKARHDDTHDGECKVEGNK